MSQLRVVDEFIIPKCSSRAFDLKKGQVMRVIAHEGKQVADIRFLNRHNFKEQFSAWVTLAIPAWLGQGDRKSIKKLYSRVPWHNHMLTILEDKVNGEHFLSGQCTPRFYEVRQGKPEHISCAVLFDRCLKPYGISMEDLDSVGVFNVFMPVKYIDSEKGLYQFLPPSCEKGDYTEFRAEMDILVAATSCPADDLINDYDPKAMKYQILE